ncbi:MAG: polysaccharide deacetylase family protein [Oscillospiraceae bacterium]|nr:polysaccharide deacetylase family protein [Oscillospiraceae bacterium]
MKRIILMASVCLTAVLLIITSVLGSSEYDTAAAEGDVLLKAADGDVDIASAEGADGPAQDGDAAADDSEAQPEENKRDIDPSKKMVALTFDDGPGEKSTPMILDAMEKYGVVCTFFELGENAERYPDYVKREEELGCEVASHTYSHQNLLNLDSEQLRSEIDKADNAFIEILGHAPKLMRPPYGNTNEEVQAAINQAMVTWSVDTLDWKYKDSERLLDFIENYGDLDKQVVLMHSIIPTAEAIDEMVAWLLEQGYQLVTTSELLEYGYGATVSVGDVYGYEYFM